MSVWAGAFNVYLYTFFPRIGRLFLLIIASSGVSEILDPVFPLLNYASGLAHAAQMKTKRETHG